MIAMIGIITIISMVAWGAKARFMAGMDQATIAQRDKAPIPTNIQVETFRLGLTGFEPREITLRPGPFVLGIDNYGSRNASFELVSEDGKRAHEIKWPMGQTRYRKLLNLPPGNYVLRDVTDPNWTAQITIGK